MTLSVKWPLGKHEDLSLDPQYPHKSLMWPLASVTLGFRETERSPKFTGQPFQLNQQTPCSMRTLSQKRGWRVTEEDTRCQHLTLTCRHTYRHAHVHIPVPYTCVHTHIKIKEVQCRCGDVGWVVSGYTAGQCWASC